MNSDRRHPEPGGDVVRPAVVAEKQRACRHQPGQLGQRQFADQRDHGLGMAQLLGQVVGHGLLARGADQHDLCPIGLNETVHDRGEIGGRPLPRFIAGAGVDADQRAVRRSLDFAREGRRQLRSRRKDL